MSDAPFNPGPWHFNSGLLVIADADGQDLARMPNWLFEYRDERDANARLIAAAPDLLSALDHLLTLFCDLAPLGENTEREVAVINARAAIAKATGRDQ